MSNAMDITEENFKAEVLEVLQNNKLTFSDSRCYGYLIDSIYEIVRTK